MSPSSDKAARRVYSREALLALRDSPKCRGLPEGLDSDDLSDLQESCFFDKAPAPDAGIYLGPQRGPAGPRAPFGAPGRRPAGAGPIHSRLIDEDERGFQRANSNQLPTAFAGSPSKAQAIAAGRGGAGGGGRYEDPAKMDRWDSRKLAAADRGGPDADGWQQQKGRGGDNWRDRGAAAAGAAAGGMRGSLDQRGGAGWGGRDSNDLPRTGSSAPKDNGGGRWVKDDDDWRARKQSGAVPEPRYDWSDNRAAPPGLGPGAAQRGPPPGFGPTDRERAPEWADADPGARQRMTAADIEAERLRMQEQWKKQGGTAHGAAQSSMAELMTDDDIMSMMAEEQEKQAREEGRGRGAANGKPDGGAAAAAAAAAPHAGQHVDVAALLGGRPQPAAAPPQPGSPGGGSPGSERAGAEGVRSRFANFFKLEESPAPSAGGPPAAGAAAAPGAGGAAAPVAKPQQLSFEELSRGTAAAAAAARGSPAPAMPARVATPGEIEQRMPGAPGIPPHTGPGLPPGTLLAAAQSRDAGQALLAMLRQQQAAQAAAGGGGQARPVMPPGAVSASEVTVLEEADKVARLTALQGLDDEILGEAKAAPAGHASPQQAGPPQPGAPGAMHLPPGMAPPPGQPRGPLPPGMPGYPGQLPPGMHPGLQHPGHMPPHGAPGYPPHGLAPPMGPPPPGMQHGPPPPGMQYRPPAGMQYRPPGVGLPPQPGQLPPGMPPPGSLQQQQQHAQQQALLAQLLAAQANRGPPPQQQPQVQPGQQINLAALLGAAGAHGMQLPPMPQQALNPAQLQGLRGPPQGLVMPPGMAPGPGLPAGFNPALLQQLQMQQGLQRPPMGPPPMQQHPAPQQQLSSAQLMAALGLQAQGGMQGMR